jgi:hypothetical protein
MVAGDSFYLYHVRVPFPWYPPSCLVVVGDVHVALSVDKIKIIQSQTLIWLWIDVFYRILYEDLLAPYSLLGMSPP